MPGASAFRARIWPRCGAAAVAVSLLVVGHNLARAEESKSKTGKADAGVAAYVGSEPISIAEVDAVALKNMKLAQQVYDARRAAVDQVVLEKALAAEAASGKTTVDKLINDRVAAKAKPVTDADVEAYFKANSGRMGGKTLEQVSPSIRDFLTQQNQRSAKDELVKEVMAKSNVRIVLEAPRVEVAVAANDPVKGPKDAKVTIVEFSEFQ